VAGRIVAPTPHSNLETPGLAEGERRRHIVDVNAARDRRRPPIDQQVEAEARPLVRNVAFDKHVAR
jgi:hypothetical protein